MFLQIKNELEVFLKSLSPVKRRSVVFSITYQEEK